LKQQTIMSIINEYKNYIQGFSNLHFTMNELDQDKHLETIVTQIISNKKLLQEAMNECPEFKWAYSEHFDDNGQLRKKGIYVHAPSTFASFLTSLIMGRFH